MKVAFYDVAALYRPLCVRRLEAVPRRGERVTIDAQWDVVNVIHVILACDDPIIKVLLERVGEIT